MTVSLSRARAIAISRAVVSPLHVTKFRPFTGSIGFPLNVISSSSKPKSLLTRSHSSSSPSVVATAAAASSATSPSSSPVIESDFSFLDSSSNEFLEELIEKVIYGCRFMTIFGVVGSLVGSLLCFIKGCTYVWASFVEYFVNRGKVIMLLVEAIDVYLLGTVMLVFGMGLYELFVSNLDIENSLSEEKSPYRSNLFGLFSLKERPQWLKITSVNELKTKLGHVIVMILLIGLLEKSKKAAIQTPIDLLCFSASVLLSSGCLYLLSKLTHDSK